MMQNRRDMLSTKTEEHVCLFVCGRSHASEVIYWRMGSILVSVCLMDLAGLMGWLEIYEVTGWGYVREAWR